ncbi:hypothetical protein Q1M64_00955 (plasmid) [Sinorhizobium meliloti]|nr:hypothetical protein LZK74_07185 [Sinorhizobium meliloti]WKL24064.1 hypothetical protein Q1M63_07855 [Sinorhizobium meliloti]WKL27915.1 hypothetical protein Q1M65_06205 [Sinorhizobium meliloti]WKL33478.1 hypothetical protein Q1M62_05835 [Sinorhizobium meliloti]WKL39365.1 hypothetical protein Q1M64_00955 [Sinorhizobium meliloti]
MAKSAPIRSNDLADGRTGPAAAKWLRQRGIPSIFVTGQEAIAAEYPETALATIGKPVSESELAEKLELFRLTSSTSKTI